MVGKINPCWTVLLSSYSYSCLSTRTSVTATRIAHGAHAMRRAKLCLGLSWDVAVHPCIHSMGIKGLITYVSCDWDVIRVTFALTGILRPLCGDLVRPYFMKMVPNIYQCDAILACKNRPALMSCTYAPRGRVRGVSLYSIYILMRRSSRERSRWVQ